MRNHFDENALQRAKQLANTPAGQQLLETMRKTDPSTLEKAAKQASSGDFSKLAETLAPLLASEEVKALLNQIGG